MVIDNLAGATRMRLRALGEESSIRSAADAFADSRLGLIVVCNDADQASGVVSKSDLVRYLADAGPIDGPVTEIMSRALVCGSPADDLRTTWELMVTRQLQNLPLLAADRKPIGMLDIRDALQALLKLEQDQEDQLVRYIAGTGYR